MVSDYFIYEKLGVDFLKNEKMYLAIYLFIICLLLILEIFGLSKIKTNIFSSVDKNTLLFNNIIYLCLLFLTILIVNIIFKYVNTELTRRWRDYIRNIIFQNTIKKYSVSYEDMNVGKYLNINLFLQNTTSEFINYDLKSIITNFLIILFISGYFIYFDITKFGIITICYIILYSISGYIVFPKITELNHVRYIDNIKLTEDKVDVLLNLSNIYINNQDDKEIYKSKEKSDKYENKVIETEYVTFKYKSCYNILSISFISLLVYIAYKQYYKNQLDKSNFIFIILLLSILYKSIFEFNDVLFGIFKNCGIWNACNLFVKNIFNHDNNNNNEINTNINFLGDIVFKNVYYTYGNKNDLDDYLYKNVNLQIDGKKITAFVGSSGSGKSTITKLLIKLYMPQKGTISIDNVDYTTINTNTLRTNINYVNQQTILFNKSILENIQYGNDKLTEKEIIDFIEKYDLQIIFKEIKGGLQANCGVNGNKLSLGMQKIVILLRGILKENYKIIIFDEPLAGLDGYHRKNIINLIKQLSVNKTVIIITHEKEILYICDKVIDIEEIKNGAVDDKSIKHNQFKVYKENFIGLHDNNSLHSVYNPLLTVKDYISKLFSTF